MKRVRAAAVLSFALAATGAHAGPTLMGYYDFEYLTGDLSKYTGGKFDQHHLSIFAQHEVGIFRFFTEIEFEHAPKIEDKRQGAGAIGFGKVFVERAWAEANVHPLFAIRAGRMLTESLWQQNHYPNLTMSVTKPQIVNAVFKGDFLGVQAGGRTEFGLGYRIWTFRGDPETSVNASGHATAGSIRNGLGGGGRLGYSARVTGGNLEVGALVAHHPDPTPITPKGVDLNLSLGAFKLWAEYAAKAGMSGAYGIASYSFPLESGELSPYLLFDTIKKESEDDHRARLALGLNYQPRVNIVLKGELLRALPANGVSAESSVSFAFVYFFD